MRRLGVADHAFDRRGLAPQVALDRIHLLVDILHAQAWIDAAMEIDDFALVRFAHADIVDIADHAAFGGTFGEGERDGLDALGRRFTAARLLGL